MLLQISGGRRDDKQSLLSTATSVPEMWPLSGLLRVLSAEIKQRLLGIFTKAAGGNKVSTHHGL
jgi:catalase (peroxidase I)